MSLPNEVLKKWREDVNKMCYVGLHGSGSSSPEIEELMIADYLLERAYAHDPLVIAWLDTYGHTVEDLEAEIERLRSALARRRVGAKIIDVLKMREDIAEKERHLTPLLELELILEGAQKKEKWAEERMSEKGFATVEELEAEVNRLRGIVGDPQIEPLILKDHIETNIARLADYVQTEGAIGFFHDTKRRAWVPDVSVAMGVDEPILYTSGLLGISPFHAITDSEAWWWSITRRKALSALETIKPYLMADKLEQAKYVLNVGRAMPDTEYRPMYIGIVRRRRYPVFLYPEYADFPIKYSIVVHKGEILPRPMHPLIPIKYTPDGMPIRWHEGMVRDP